MAGTSKEILCQCYKPTGKCYAPATVKIERANTYACDECYASAVLRLGCNLTYSNILTPTLDGDQWVSHCKKAIRKEIDNE